MAGIFIGYRRDDSAGHARALFDRLRAHFGAELVFMDVTDIEPGMDFTEVLDKASVPATSCSRSSAGSGSRPLMSPAAVGWTIRTISSGSR